MSETGWSLDPQLAANTAPVGDLPLSRVLALNDANFPWLILVPRRIGLIELTDLEPDQSSLLMQEVSTVGRALKEETRCDKLNIAAIGNIVPQLHIHIVARRKDDALWPKPVWGAEPQRRYEPAAIQHFARTIAARLQLARSA